MTDQGNSEKDKYGRTKIVRRREEINRQIRVREARLALAAAELPHRYGFKWYKWAWDYYKSTNRMNIICAANQISKSSTAIRKDIEWATNKALWPIIWPNFENGTPNIPRQFWYLYPTADIATSEFHTKWMPEFMPRVGKYCNVPFKEKCEDTTFGYEVGYERKKIYCINWASGITQYFKTYAQNVHALQSGSIHKITGDEELPEELYDELAARLRSTRGVLDLVFTATRNQLLWLLAVEGKGQMEKFKNAFKQQITMYDCRFYMDGTPGRWHDEAEIQKAIEECKDQSEVQRRIFGRFVADKGRKYPAFDPTRHFVEPFDIPRDYLIYGGVDPGSGGKTGHPTGMGLIAVRPDFKRGYVIDGWRGDGLETTDGDALQRFIELRGNRRLSLQVADKTQIDFFRIANRIGESFTKAENAHDVGEQVVNTLFGGDMLFIFNTPELHKLGNELLTLMADTPKNRAKDDFIDGAVRYPSVMIPWDFSAFKRPVDIEAEAAKARPKERTEEEVLADEIRRRRGEMDAPEESEWAEFQDEIDYWNDQY